jgi:hypothetical protein
LKPTERVLEVDSTLAGENVRMGIDTSALQHIISVLTDLYSDPELAVIREYSTNALDAHKDAGNPLPIEVTTPTPLAPFFRVRDYGDGLDAEDIRNIYSRYGTSTKRDSNDVVGMLGLGCKSALTYSDQFTLVGVKDGRTVQVSVHRDEDGGGSMTIVSDEATPDAPSGVEVIVPAKHDNAFGHKAERFFRFWTKGTVLVNGKEPEHISDQVDPTWLVPDKLFVYDPSKTDDGNYNAYFDTSSPDWVVMGNVAYPMPDESNQRNRKYRIVAFVDIGDVNFTPSREALQLTSRTKATLADIMETTKRELAAAMQKRVAAAANPADAIRRVQEANVYGVKTADLTFEGKQIPTTLERSALGPATAESTYLVVSSDRYARRKSGDRLRQIPPYGSGRLVFTGFEANEFSTAKRQKFDAWLDQEGVERPKAIICVDKLTPDEAYWLKGTPIYDWTPVQAIKVEKAATVGGYRARPSGSYEKESGGHIEAGDIDLTVPLLWTRPDERHSPYDWRTRKNERTYPDGTLVLVMPANRLDKFKRDFAHAMHWRNYVKKEATDWLDQQDAALVEAAKYRISGQGTPLSGLDPAQITDPDLAAWVRLQNTPASAVQSGIEKRSNYLDINRCSLSSKYPDPLKEYPLVGNGGAKLAEHIYLYVNAAFAATHPAKEDS